MKVYKGKKLSYAKHVSRNHGGKIYHDGRAFSKKEWANALKLWSWAWPGDIVFNSFTNEMDVIENIELEIEHFGRTGNCIVGFWVHTEKGYILSDAFKTKNDFLNFWGYSDEEWVARFEFIEKWRNQS